MESIDTIISSSVSNGPIEMASELTPGISMNTLQGNNKSYFIYYIIGGTFIIVAGLYFYKKINEIKAAQNIKEELKRT